MVDDQILDHLRLVRVLMDRDGLAFDDALLRAGPLIPTSDYEAVRRRYEDQSSTTITVLGPQVIAGPGGMRPWFDNYDPSKGYYWRRQRRFLLHDLGRRDYEIDSLDISTNRILAHLEDPGSLQPFAVRGLVIGYVQSGKTQSFSALIAKAADAGYKIVIVLSGLHNTLRKQTQRRLERDLGRENVQGVGEPEAGRRWQWMTGAEDWGDFDPRGVNAALLQGNEQVIFVVKKNKSRLERLNEWMSGRVPDHVPVLVIDDEADQASINTGGNRSRDEYDLASGADFAGDLPDDDEVDPSTINKNIRLLLNNFAKSTYVAYTATPFANVLINPAAFDANAGNDLFPNDFIISLPPPPGDIYVGSAQLFGRDRLPGDADDSVDMGMDVIQFVPDHEVDLIVPPAGRRAGFVPSITPTLKQALVDYVLAAAALLQRSEEDQPCTMLVHTDMQRAMQDPLGPQVAKEIAYIRQRWLYDAHDYRPHLKQRWDERFRPVSASMDLRRDVPFKEIEEFVDRLLRDGIEVKVLNSNWPDTLDFDAEPHMKAVLIGGNKLSRGITIEGLLVSYYVRETLYYDTLMQMARWFGYRGRYADLTRLYSTELLVSCFHDLATAEEELRRQIGRYEKEEITPREFVPKIRMHPVMAVTQRSKMQDAVSTRLNFAAVQEQTLRLPRKPTSALIENVAVTRDLFSALGTPDNSASSKPGWSDVDPAPILAFIERFHVLEQTNLDISAMIAYIKDRLSTAELCRWRVLLSCSRTLRDDPTWWADLSVDGRPRIPLITRSRLVNDPTSLGVISEPGDERFGLSDDQINDARDQLARGEFTSLAEAIRSQRDPSEGLLIVYPISPASQVGSNARNRQPLFDNPGSDVPPVIAYAISFPPSPTASSVDYVSAPLPRDQP